MKSNSHVQMEPQEFVALMDVFKHAITVFGNLAAANMASVRESYEDGGSAVDVVDGADHFVPEEAEATFSAPVATPPAPVAAQPAPEGNLAEAFTGDKNTRLVKPVGIKALPADHPLVSRGRKEFYRMVDIWQQGFAVEDAPQPDRLDAMKSTMANNGGPVIAYLRYIGGLVAGVRDFFTAAGGEATPATDAWAIQIATNIAQVGSVVHPELTDMLEFIRPDGTIIPHVRYEQVRVPLAGEE